MGYFLPPSTLFRVVVERKLNVGFTQQHFRVHYQYNLHDRGGSWHGLPVFSRDSGRLTSADPVSAITMRSIKDASFSETKSDGGGCGIWELGLGRKTATFKNFLAFALSGVLTYSSVQYYHFCPKASYIWQKKNKIVSIVILPN